MSLRNFFAQRKHLLRVILFLILLTALSFFLQRYAPQLLTSVLPVPPHAPFDGTVSPIQNIPNWVALTEQERAMTYDELPPSKITQIPPYEPPKLRVLLTSLSWGDPLDDTIRNAKITYSVPYLGNYKLDGEEGGGSHPGVDIKAPIGTPVYAIANGSVVKSGLGGGGSGNQIILRHNDVPDINDPVKTVTLHSAYLHLSEVLVEPLTTVTKGQLIGKVGKTGIATTPHLHFQIDTEDATYHPYWPFTWKEAQDAGLSFFEAINAGLGKEKSITATINPLAYIDRFEHFQTSAITPPEPALPEPANEPLIELAHEPAPPELPAESPAPVEVISTEPALLPEETPIDVTPAPSLPVAPPEEPSFQFTDVPNDHQFAQAIYFLKSRDKIKGYDDGTFQPEKSVNRVEALKMLLSGLDISLQENRELDFSDTQTGAWYNQYLVTAFDRGIVRGYDDKTFRPTNEVIRAEFLKMLILTFGGNVELYVSEAPYSDVPVGAWFTPFVATAKTKNFLSFIQENFLPAQSLTRGEVAELMYRAMVTKDQQWTHFDEELFKGG